MIDKRNIFTENNAIFLNTLKSRGIAIDLVELNKIETDRKDAQIRLEKLQSTRNILSKEVGKKKMAGEDITEISDRVRKINNELENQKSLFNEAEKKLEEILATIPNIIDDSVPIGNNENDNKLVKKVGDIPQFSFPIKDHVELGKTKGLDFSLAQNISGSRFAVLKGNIAKMHRALIQFMLDNNEKQGYEECYVPSIVLGHNLYNTGQLPKFEDDLFKADDFYLIPTSEVSLTNFANNRIFKENELPLKLTAHTSCYRKEAGSHGKDIRGMIRQHQFDKVELVQITKPENSMNSLEHMLATAENILKTLNLAYRVVTLCSGDIGFSAAKTYDIEVWIPSQNKYREISSCSNCTDFQARRMKARYKNPISKKNELVHTLNGSSLAVGRTLVAVLENYQQQDESIAVPDALQPYMKGLKSF